MKEVLIEREPHLAKKIKCSLDAVVSVVNLATDEQIEAIVKDIFSSYDKIYVQVLVYRAAEKATIKVNLKYFEESNLILGILDFFLYRLGNVRIFQKNVEYINVI